MCFYINFTQEEKKIMKSINEKAEEYTSDITNPVTNNAAFLAFKAGANYVLEEIEKLVKFNRWSAQDLYELIEQLKSN